MRYLFLIVVFFILYFFFYPSDKDIKKTLETLSAKKEFKGGKDFLSDDSPVNEFGIIKGLPSGSGTTKRSY